MTLFSCGRPKKLDSFSKKYVQYVSLNSSNYVYFAMLVNFKYCLTLFGDISYYYKLLLLTEDCRMCCEKLIKDILQA